MLFCKDGSSWLDVIDDAGVLVRRLEILENLLRKCTFDMPRTECKFVDIPLRDMTEAKCCCFSMSLYWS